MTEALDELERLALRSATEDWYDRETKRSIVPPKPLAILALLSDRRADRERMAEMEKLLREVRAEIAAYADYEHPNRQEYPDEMRRWKRDMDLAYCIDATLKETGNG